MPLYEMNEKVICRIFPNPNMKRMCSCSIIRVCGDLGMTKKKNSGDMLVAINVFEMPIVLLLIDNHCLFQTDDSLSEEMSLGNCEAVDSILCNDLSKSVSVIRSNCSSNHCKNDSRRWRRKVYRCRC